MLTDAQNMCGRHAMLEAVSSREEMGRAGAGAQA